MRVVVHDRGRALVGAVRPGESWRAAARRTAASMHIEPGPLDLSGQDKQFMVDHDNVIALRATTRGDLGDLLRWRRSDHLRRWWTADGEPTAAALEERYGPRIDGMSPIRMWIVEINGRSVGFVQDYRIGDHPEYSLLGPDPDAIGVDYALAEEWSGRGLGAQVLWVWMSRIHRRRPGVATYFAAPDHRNTASRRMLAKAGFDEGLWFDVPMEDGSTATVVGCTLDVAAVLGRPPSAGR